MAAAMHTASAAITPTAAAAPVPQGAKVLRVLVVHVHRAGTDAPNAEAIRQQWFGARGRALVGGEYVGASTPSSDTDSSVTGFYLVASGNRMLLSGDVVVHQISNPRCGGLGLAKEMIQSLGYDAAKYDRVVYEDAACGMNFAEISGKFAMVDGRSRTTRTHELGHTFGLGHSALLGCKDAAAAPVSLSANTEQCTRPEYTDLLTTMGRAGSLFHAHELQKLGWLDDSEIQTLTPRYARQTVQVRPLYGAGDPSLPRQVNVNLGDGRTLLLSYRARQAPFDAWSGSFASTPAGAIVHLQQRGQLTALVDAQPTLTDRSWAFAAGQVLTDPASQVTLTFEAVDAGGVRFSVMQPDTIAPTRPTALRLAKEARGGHVERVRLSWAESSDENSGVAYYRVTQTGGLSNGKASFTWNTTTPTMARNVALGQAVVFSVVAVDRAGNISSPADISYMAPR